MGWDVLMDRVQCDGQVPTFSCCLLVVVGGGNSLRGYCSAFGTDVEGMR